MSPRECVNVGISFGCNFKVTPKGNEGEGRVERERERQTDEKRNTNGQLDRQET